MKKSIYYILGLLIAQFAMVGCGDNDNFWGEHILTAEEIRQMEIQDSIDAARRAKIDADFIHEYSVDIIISEISYDGTFLNLDYPRMAADFGISETELLHGIANLRAEYLENGAYTDGAKLTGFAIEGSTHQDNMTAYNTNGFWGHWWNADGDVTNWGDDARVFCEYYEPEDDSDPIGFNVGQMPGKLAAGDKITVIECLKYQDMRMAIVITVNAKEREAVTANVVYEENISVDMSPNDAGSYDPTAVPFNLNEVLKATGLSAIDPASNLIAYNSDGQLWSELNADSGFWFDKSGPIGNWGDNASCWISYGFTDDPATIGVCLMPGATAVGDKYDHKFGFVNGNKLAILNVHINVIAFNDEEQVPAGDPCTVEKTINLSKTFSRDYANVTADIKDILKDAFKMTTYQIFSAKNDGSLKVYQGSLGSGDPQYTGADCEYWLNGNGEACGWGEGVVYSGLVATETSLEISLGNHPDNCDPNGAKIATKYYITCNGGTAILNLNFEITGFSDPETKPGTTPADATMDIKAVKAYSNDYASVDEDVRDLVRNAFNLTTYGVETAINNGDMKFYINSVSGDGVGTGSNPAEFWLDAEGNPTDWGNGCIYYGLYADAQEGYIMLGGGNHPDNCDPSKTYNLKFKFIVVYQGTTVTFNVDYTVNPA